MDVSRLMILLKEAWSRVRDEGVGVMGDFIGKPFTATTMSELNYLVRVVPGTGRMHGSKNNNQKPFENISAGKRDMAYLGY